MPRIRPCLWFDGQAEEAAEFYVSVFPNSEITARNTSAMDWPGGRAGDVILVEFSLDGQEMQALNGGPYATFNESVSLSVPCPDQAGLDRLWAALLADGGEEMQCGWLKDRYGLRWQLVPEPFEAMLREADEDQSKRLMAAMMEMVKLDLAALERACRGGAPAR
ncbi:VOC family protein [Limimaricola sp. AA108-03]|uniref:VOC family protein n=1 Tax=Limimaricola sp. AA108-03 TaxID=3425945 RepID=UPI003D780398